MEVKKARQVRSKAKRAKGYKDSSNPLTRRKVTKFSRKIFVAKRATGELIERSSRNHSERAGKDVRRRKYGVVQIAKSGPSGLKSKKGAKNLIAHNKPNKGKETVQAAGTKEASFMRSTSSRFESNRERARMARREQHCEHQAEQRAETVQHTCFRRQTPLNQNSSHGMELK